MIVRLFDGQRPVNNQTVKVYPEEFRGNQTIKKMMKFLFRFGLLLFGLAIVAFGLFYIRANNRLQPILSKEIPPISKQRDAKVLSAFFGLDNSLPLAAIGLSWKAPGKDGMPVVFSHEINPTTLEASDFKIKTAKGKLMNVDVVTLRPAVEAFELRTVLLIGEVGNHPDDEPVEVAIIGDLLARSGQNFKGHKVSVTPLVKGPFLSYAEYFKLDDSYPYVAEGRGCDCPREKTKMVVRTVWAGGVRALNGEELGDKELQNFRVALQMGKDTLMVYPFQLADLSDNDNNIDLCINKEGIPLTVSVQANTAIDPRDDANNFTNIGVVARW